MRLIERISAEQNKVEASDVELDEIYENLVNYHGYDKTVRVGLIGDLSKILNQISEK